MEKLKTMDTRRGRFELNPSEIRTQQSLEGFYEDYLPRCHPEVLEVFDAQFPIQEGSAYTHAMSMALRSCLPVTAWNFMKSGGAIDNVGLEEFIHRVWPAFDYSNTRVWYRPALTRLIHREFGIGLVSAGVKWLDSEITTETSQQMIQAGYCGDLSDFQSYLTKLHGKDLREIIADTPALITIKNPVGAQMSHSVIAWEINGETMSYINSDERDIPKESGFCEGSLLMLDSDEAKVGAVTILV